MEDKKAAYDQEFRKGVVNYKKEHPDESFVSIGKKFGMHSTTIEKWNRDAEEKGEVVVCGSLTYESDEAKEIAHLKKELRDYKDAVEVLKKLLAYWEIAAQHIYEAVTDAKNRKPCSIDFFKACLFPRGNNAPKKAREVFTIWNSVFLCLYTTEVLYHS